MKPQVSLIRAETYQLKKLRSDLEKLLAPLGGITTFVKPGDRVLLKPNLLLGSRPTKECVTRPEVVFSIAEMVIEAGGKPFLGDAPAFGSALGVAKSNNYLPLLEKLNIPVVEFHGKRYQTISEQFNHLLLSKEVMEADVVINLPKIKSHCQLTMTMGVKNLFGCVPGKMKAWWHFEAGKNPQQFGQMLVETARAINPDLTIVDGIIGHEGNGPSGGEPRFLGVLGASTNVFALDRALIEIVQVKPELVPTVAASIKLGLCSDLTAIEFPELTPKELMINDWQLPPNMIPIDFGMPRIIRSTFKHLYIKFIKEPINLYAAK
jgi:uncharacterized protein (DUF362 family)